MHVKPRWKRMKLMSREEAENAFHLHSALQMAVNLQTLNKNPHTDGQISDRQEQGLDPPTNLVLCSVRGAGGGESPRRGKYTLPTSRQPHFWHPYTQKGYKRTHTTGFHPKQVSWYPKNSNSLRLGIKCVDIYFYFLCTVCALLIELFSDLQDCFSGFKSLLQVCASLYPF